MALLLLLYFAPLQAAENPADLPSLLQQAQEGQLVEALAVLERSQAPSNDALRLQAYLEKQLGDYSAGRKTLRELLRRLPDDPTALRELAYVEWLAGRYAPAKELLDQLLSLSTHADQQQRLQSEIQILQQEIQQIDEYREELGPVRSLFATALLLVILGCLVTLLWMVRSA